MKTKSFFRRASAKLRKGRAGRLLYHLYSGYTSAEYHLLCFFQTIAGRRRPSKEDAVLVSENVTFLFKSFERQKMARKLCKNILSYFPDAKIVVADDSKEPLEIDHPNVKILPLPFNSGLSFGLNRALEQVNTPFVMRMDDDELLTPNSRIEEQLKFLFSHPEIDLVAVQACTAPHLTRAKKAAKHYDAFKMDKAPLKLIVPHMTRIDKTHVVKGKTANIFLARTDKLKEVGYDDNIKRIDHHEFFFRAAGRLVSCMDESASVFHYHNPFDDHYLSFRTDYKSDEIYICQKHNLKPVERK